MKANAFAWRCGMLYFGRKLYPRFYAQQKEAATDDPLQGLGQMHVYGMFLAVMRRAETLILSGPDDFDFFGRPSGCPPPASSTTATVAAPTLTATTASSKPSRLALD